MEKLDVEVDGRSGEALFAGDERSRLKFQGWKIASFKVPYDGEERLGSIGIDFDLYLTNEGRLLLLVENWSRRPGGRNYRIFETFGSIDEMRRRGIREGSYTVELPDRLISRAERALCEDGLASVLDEMLSAENFAAQAQSPAAYSF